MGMLAKIRTGLMNQAIGIAAFHWPSLFPQSTGCVIPRALTGEVLHAEAESGTLPYSPWKLNHIGESG
jgi:hypothetical protein